MSFFKKFFSREKEQELEQGLEKTKSSLFQKISKAVAGKAKVDVEVLDELEAALISSDVGLDTTIKIIDRIEARVARDKYLNVSELNNILRDEIAALLTENNTVDLDDFDLPQGKKPYVLLVVGVNGVGKTTTIGKLAYQYKQKGYNVLLGAGDTFRAAAVDQLKVWADRVGCAFFSKGMDTDPAAVAFEAVQEGMRSGADVIIIDTAGRLHTKTHLMRELTKIQKSIDKCLPGAPHDVMLVLDATTGQNAFEQCRQFSEATEVTILALTKLDGTAKGGVALGISDQFKIPIRFIGVGERIDQLQVFNKKAFVDSLFKGAAVNSPSE
jgi:fused signal recognition particle receptor